ncbi:MAG TPA: hypothetical protein VED20_03930 [Streptosporangiaceae bacterium]|nr:hypothetical protein [Streptosporangiaceae bacterium]
MTLAHAGARVVALVNDQERQQSYAVFRLGAALRWRVPVWTSTAVRRVAGRGRLAGVEVADVRTGASRFVPCDTPVFSGDWIPDHELARLEVRQDDRLLARSRRVRLIPGRSAHLGADWLPWVDPAGGPVHVAASA